MDKDYAILKINKVGQIGNVISIIALAFSSLAALLTFIALIVMAIMPKDFVTVNGNATGYIEVDLGKVGGTIDEDTVGEIMQNVTVGGGSSVVIPFVNTEVDGNVLRFATEEIETKIDIKGVTSLLFPALVVIALYIVTIVFIMLLCRAFATCKTPFSDLIVKRLRMLAFSLIPWVFFDNITSALQASFAKGFLTGVNVNYNLSINLRMLLIVLVVLMLSFIFRYGAVLQTESDETL
ncbi:MAG: DUF2975 domain-containing protein [Lachnospiraceae bacterium]|nr:DUF2975 domain-containing protein [Lachnospiraceae bacterium]